MSKLFLSALFLMTFSIVAAQEHYNFNCRDYVSTDDSRAPQSVFSYDRTANTITIKATGTNNVAFKMAEGLDGEYYIDSDETLLMVCGENLSLTSGHSLLWWLNGSNNPGAQPDKNFTDQSDKVFIWDLKTNSSVNRNFNYSESRVPISSHGSPFILAVGFTAQDANKPGVIKDFGYYAPFEVAAKHPSLMQRLGFTATSLTSAIKRKTLQLDSSRKEAIDQIASNDYAAAYQLYKEVRAAYKSEDEGTHTVSYEKSLNGIHARFDDQHIRIQFYNDSTVRVSKGFNMQFNDGESWAVTASPDAEIALSVVEHNGVVSMESSKMRVEYTLSNGRAELYRSDGQLLLMDKGHKFQSVKDGPFDSYTISQYLEFDDDERIYGMGQLQDGQLDRRGTAVKLEQNNRSICIPYFLSSKNYGFYWDNYSPTIFNDTGSRTLFRSTGQCIDYYVLAASNSHEVQRSLRHLTGECQLPPLWNFGLYQSKERYVSANEVMSVVRKYRNQKIPFDCLVQDWQYWGDNAHWNAMEFLNPDYSNYQQMINFIHQNHAKLMISIWANFGPSTKPFAELRDKDLLFTSETWPLGAGVKPYNPFSAEARDIYWKYLWNGIASKGVDAYWMDSTEPDFFGSESDLDNVALEGKTWRSLRNAFPLATVEGVSQHHLAQPELSDKRVSIMTRSGYLGMQRTGAYVWSADITSSWETLANQIPAACNLAESGLPYWNSDTGGFFTGNYGGVGDAAWRRLYLRWTQFSVFTPMLRFHGTNTPREPWQFGSAGDSRGEYDNIVRYIRLRYRLLPYLYSTAHQVRVNAEGFMQALPIAFPDDSDTYSVKDQYMFGKAFLVAPVLSDGVIDRKVYLPHTSSNRWIDFWTGYTMRGGKQITKTAPMDLIPLYVPAGTILPWGPDVQYSTEKPWDALEIRVYPGADGQFTLYEDEFDNHHYQQGAYSEIPMSWDEASKTLTIGARKGNYDGMLQNRKFRIVAVSPDKGVGDGESILYDAEVSYDGTAIRVPLQASNVPAPGEEDFPDAIKTVSSDPVLGNNAHCYYTLSGHEIQHPSAGLYVHNGQVVFQK